MDWRTRRQLLILLIVAGVVFGVLGLIGYALLHQPGSCTDNKLNQGEEEVDCGGPCAPCAFKHQKSVEVFYARFVEVRPKNYDIVAEVQNPNEHLAGRPLIYRTHLFDDKGAEVGRRDGETYVYPNDRIYIIEGNFVTERTVVEAKIEILPDETRWQYTNALHPDLTVGNKQYEVVTVDDRELSYESAVLTNRESAGFHNVDVRVALLDKDGNIAGVAKTIVQNLPPGGTRKVEFTWPNKIAADVDRVELEARADGLNQQNILIPR